MCIDTADQVSGADHGSDDEEVRIARHAVHDEKCCSTTPRSDVGAAELGVGPHPNPRRMRDGIWMTAVAWSRILDNVRFRRWSVVGVSEFDCRSTVRTVREWSSGPE